MGSDNAAEIIRKKLARVYADEPDALQESAEAEHSSHRSKHQQFMYELSTSGKSLAAVQTEWHNYYQKLPEVEKLKVWEEFYASQPQLTGAASPASTDTAHVMAQHKHVAS
jgi:hypothetical protein